MYKISIALFDPGFKFNDPRVIFFQDQELTLQQKLLTIGKKFIESYDKINAKAKIDKDHRFLFVCPENTFINFSDKSGCNAYSKEEIAEIENYFLALSTQYPNSIIFPGTANVIKTLKLDDNGKVKKYTDTLLEPLNEIGIGVQAESNFFENMIKDRTCFKNTGYIFADGQTYKYSKSMPRKELVRDRLHTLFYRGRKPPFLTLNNLKIGLEICVEHDSCLVKHKQAEESYKAFKQLDLQIVVSNGVQTRTSNFANNGKNIIFMNCVAGFSLNSMCREEAGVWIGDEACLITKVPCSLYSRDLLIYPEIMMPANDPTLSGSLDTILRNQS